MMSYRQCCDRCHERKVRCTKLTLPEDTTQTIFTCDRCVHAGASCVYSLKQKTGRPLVTSLRHSDLSTEALGRVEQGSLAYSNPSPAKPHLTDITLGFSLKHNELQVDDVLGIGIDPDIFLMGPSSDFVPPASLDNERRKGERSWVPDVKALHNTSQNDTTDSTYETGQLEALVADISGLDLRILRYARLVQDSASKVLTVSSPHLEGIFEATAQLLKILDWFQRRGEQKPPISNLLNYSDRGLTFGVLAVHQRLLHAYGTVYTLVKRRVQEASWSTMEHVAQGSNWIGPQPPVYGTRTAIVEQQRATPTGGPTAHGKGALYVSMAQHVMVLQLLSHMLSRLDRALGLSRGSSARIPSFSSENSNSGDSSIFHNWSPSVGFDFVTDSAATSQPNVALLNGSGDSGQKLGSGGLLGEERETVDSTLCMESRLRQQHDALQGDIESLKSHIERSREL